MIGLEGRRDSSWLDEEENELAKIVESVRLCLWLRVPLTELLLSFIIQLSPDVAYVSRLTWPAR